MKIKEINAKSLPIDIIMQIRIILAKITNTK